MHRTEGAENVANLFVDGPPGTRVEQDWLNTIQEELANVIEAAGLTLKTASTDTRDQLAAVFAGLVHTTGDETIAGEKTFTSNMAIGAVVVNNRRLVIGGGGIEIQDGGFTPTHTVESFVIDHDSATEKTRFVSVGDAANRSGFVFSGVESDGGNSFIYFTMDKTGDIIIGASALPTNATTGFLYIPSMAGTPTGIPTAHTGRMAITYDTTNDKLYIYDAISGGWLSVTLT